MSARIRERTTMKELPISGSQPSMLAIKFTREHVEHFLTFILCFFSLGTSKTRTFDFRNPVMYNDFNEENEEEVEEGAAEEGEDKEEEEENNPRVSSSILPLNASQTSK